MRRFRASADTIARRLINLTLLAAITTAVAGALVNLAHLQP